MDVLGSRLLHRTGTVAALATAAVLGASGLALGATTHDVNGPAAPVPVTGPAATVPATVATLAPLPRPQVAPVVRDLSRQVTSTVRVVRPITAPRKPAVPPAQPPVSRPKTHPVMHDSAAAAKPARHVAVVHKTTNDIATHEVAATPAREAAFVQRTTPAVVPNLAPTGPLAGLPDVAQHTLPTALVVVAAAILAALAAGHLGQWRSRRRLAVR